MEIFLDVLLLENIVMNYLILLMTAKFSKNKISHLRLFLGATVGALYVAILVVFPSLKGYYTTIAKIALSFAIVAIAFSFERFGAFFKTLAIFYISTFIFAGAGFAFLYFNQSGGFVRNGFFYVYWNSKWTVMLLGIATAGIIVKIFWDIIQGRLVRDRLLIPLKVAFENGAIDLSALVDTGNALYDPLTHVPVVVVEFNAIKSILPQEIQNIFEESKENDLVCVTRIVSDSSWFSRFRLIPFTSLGKDNGMLIGFKPDYIEVGENTEKKGVTDVIIGIYNRALSKSENYNALLGPELV
ncbi:sigma-E processing peptidase SpoIIGA [Acetivibrio cellulolyticus]|uniref:sigma-E processing peptidase SpoIIGA n=1 Tax=Acetivibrio cellulolyticus TaxID=35830 RepID=UPI0001E2EB69|nr:sigma-E processing peptidase SpoIIGA [Acetivibrio cellulolyticus]